MINYLPPRERHHVSVTVYTLPNCVQCDQTKKTMDRLDIEYATIDLSEDKEAAKMVMDLGYKQAPVVFAGDEHWGGFRLERIKSLTIR